ncbi:hypothetical protein BST81_25475 [Leptolyngbya sp. 'hensonii']|uniref:hypothetical protein n=1 Tax=Leptolyngbya sp. 'hensonii' TaxID=1922337 RepID=UPI00094FAEDC|nr:hypothetical protein [Leptolyngbya sp. 'hensonii']OLP15564.1 hypothetical protein BST81_25475 [Leptolyngbya sp. 'hensonii']
MIVFIIPLKGKKMSKDWEATSRLLDRTMRSVCRQTSEQFRAIVIHREKPETDFFHPNLHYLEVDFEPDVSSSMTAKEIRQQKRVDKGKKILSGLHHIHNLGIDASHAMVVDSDDLISCRIAAFVNQHQDAAGWFIKTGFKYLETAAQAYWKREFYKACGTCNILNLQVIDVPALELNRGYGYYKFLIDHGQVKDKLKQRGVILKPLPFPGAIYVIGTGENMASNENNLRFSWWMRKSVEPLREEFGI